MDLFDKLSKALGKSIAKFLLKVTLGDVGDVVGKPVVDVLKEHYKERLKDARAVNEAERQFSSITDEILAHLEAIREVVLA